MFLYFLKFKKKKKWKKKLDSEVLKTKHGRAMLSSQCVVCGSKKSRFMKEQEVKGILRSLGLKTQLSKIPLFGDILL